MRSRFSAETLVALEKEFARDIYPNQARLDDLARFCGIAAKSAKVWFQNKRQKIRWGDKKGKASINKPECPLYKTNDENLNIPIKINDEAIACGNEKGNINITFHLVEDSVKSDDVTVKIIPETTQESNMKGDVSSTVIMPQSSENTYKLKSTRPGKVQNKTAKSSRNNSPYSCKPEYSFASQALVPVLNTNPSGRSHALAHSNFIPITIDSNLNKSLILPVTSSNSVTKNYSLYPRMPLNIYPGSVYPKPSNQDMQLFGYNPLDTLSDVALLHNTLLKSSKCKSGAEANNSINSYYQQLDNQSIQLANSNSSANLGHSIVQSRGIPVLGKGSTSSFGSYSSVSNNISTEPNTMHSLNLVRTNITTHHNVNLIHKSNLLANQSFRPLRPWTNTTSSDANRSMSMSNFGNKPVNLSPADQTKSDPSINTSSILGSTSRTYSKRPKFNVIAADNGTQSKLVAPLKPSSTSNLIYSIPATINSNSEVITHNTDSNSDKSSTSSEQKMSLDGDKLKITESRSNSARSMPDLDLDDFGNYGVISARDPSIKLTSTKRTQKSTSEEIKENVCPPNED